MSEQKPNPEQKSKIKIIGKKRIRINRSKKVVKSLSSDDMYINSLNEKEKQVLNIAKNHLGSSFSLHKSIGYVDYFCNRKV